MRAMTTNATIPPPRTGPQRPGRRVRSRLGRVARFRPWVQTAFLAVWLAPLGQWLHRVPGCVLHCYACPLSSFACPVGVAANFAALHVVPWMLIGVLLFVGGLLGSLVCGWACPFGFLQDLLARVPVRKLRIPNWMGYGRYLVLAGLVLLVPGFWGEEHWAFICRLCPSGAVSASLPRMVMGKLDSTAPQVMMSPGKMIILPLFVVTAIVMYRPWCKILCPLGGVLALFNPVSAFRLRFSDPHCTECNTCRSRCQMGVKVEQAVNVTTCIRCMECTRCGAIEPSLRLGASAPAPEGTTGSGS